MTPVTIVVKDILLNFVMLIGVMCSLCYEIVPEQKELFFWSWRKLY